VREVRKRVGEEKGDEEKEGEGRAKREAEGENITNALLIAPLIFYQHMKECYIYFVVSNLGALVKVEGMTIFQ
jgi:hypothetical protein